MGEGEGRQPLVKGKKDLGVWTTNNMKSKRQCLAAADKAISAIRILKLSFQHLNKKYFSPLQNICQSPPRVLKTNLVSVLH